MRQNFQLLMFIVFVMFFSRCTKNSSEVVDEVEVEEGMASLIVPADFNYETSKDVVISFSGVKTKSSNQIKYTVYLYDEDYTTEDVTYTDEAGEQVTASMELTNALNNKLGSYITSNSNFELKLKVPTYCKSLYVVKNEMGIFSSDIIELNNSKASFVKKRTKATTDNVDVFYGTNGNGDLFTINELTNELTVISKLPDNTGSYTCAIDPVERMLYTIGNNYPKYSLYSYDIDKDEWDTVGSIKSGGPRLGYNRTDGLLYFSTSKYVYTLDPKKGKKLSSYKIEGMESYSGGDLTFDSDGTMYISSTDGLYKCDFIDKNSIKATWNSSESLPNYPNSLTFDSKGELWWATAIGGQGLTFIMDKVTGGFESRSTYSTIIHDLATLPYDESSIIETDTDGDGIIDFYDEFPEDDEKAATTYTPSVYGWGTYAFEDLWPNEGDYDFNDLVVNYRFVNVENADGLMVESRLNFVIKNIGGSLKNGFGIQLDMDEDLIKEVVGYKLTEGIVNVNGKGLEEDQTLPVVIAFDNAWAHSDRPNFEIVITYNQPINPSNMDNVNPFIFIGGIRGKEVHCANRKPTDLVDKSFFGSSDDASITSKGIYYKNDKNLPWGIDIIHDFAYPKEKKQIISGYPFFRNWAESGGSKYDDWYKEKDGYRDYNYLNKN